MAVNSKPFNSQQSLRFEKKTVQQLVNKNCTRKSFKLFNQKSFSKNKHFRSSSIRHAPLTKENLQRVQLPGKRKRFRKFFFRSFVSFSLLLSQKS